MFKDFNSMRPQGLIKAYKNGELSNPHIININKADKDRPKYAIAYKHSNSRYLVFQYYKVAAKLHEFISIDAAYKELRKIGFDKATVVENVEQVA